MILKLLYLFYIINNFKSKRILNNIYEKLVNKYNNYLDIKNIITIDNFNEIIEIFTNLNGIIYKYKINNNDEYRVLKCVKYNNTLLEGSIILFDYYFNKKYDFIIKPYGFIKYKNKICLSIEYLSNGDLNTFINKPENKDKIELILNNLLILIKKMINNNVKYHDLTDKNILVDDNLNLKLIDFETENTQSNNNIDLDSELIFEDDINFKDYYSLFLYKTIYKIYYNSTFFASNKYPIINNDTNLKDIKIYLIL